MDRRNEAAVALVAVGQVGAAIVTAAGPVIDQPCPGKKAFPIKSQFW